MEPQEIVDALGLERLPVEGGLWGQSWLDEQASAIYYLLVAPEFSGLHRLTHLEIFAHHAGAPARMLLLHPDGTVTRPVLGTNLAAGERPQVPVPAGTWQATETLGEWSLLGTVMSPPYTEDCVTFADDAALQQQFPAYAEEIRRLTK